MARENSLLLRLDWGGRTGLRTDGHRSMLFEETRLSYRRGEGREQTNLSPGSILHLTPQGSGSKYVRPDKSWHCKSSGKVGVLKETSNRESPGLFGSK